MNQGGKSQVVLVGYSLISIGGVADCTEVLEMCTQNDSVQQGPVETKSIPVERHYMVLLTNQFGNTEGCKPVFLCCELCPPLRCGRNCGCYNQMDLSVDSSQKISALSFGRFSAFSLRFQHSFGKFGLNLYQGLSQRMGEFWM